MSDYEAIRTEALPALEDFPIIEDTDAVTRQVNRLFTPYVFFERHKDNIELWCSCCLRHEQMQIPPRTVTTVEYELLYNKHNEYVTCPYCGARATYKNARKLGKKTKLPQYLPVVMLAEKDGDLYARAYWTRKTYATLDGAPEFYLVEGYHFTPGMATMAPTITRVRDTNEFITAVSVKERIAACLAVFIKRAVPSGGFGRGGTRTPDGGTDYEGKKLTPGMISTLGAGDGIETVNPGNSGSDAAGFLKTQQALIAAGQGLSYEAVSRDMSGATYSSARQNAIEDESTYAEDVEMLTEFMSEVYETFVISCYLSGLIEMPGFWDKKAEYLSHTWTKAPKKWIDPAKESNAGKTALQSGQKTFQDICAEQGKDWKEAINEMAEVLDYGRTVGIELGGVIYGSGTAAQQNAPDKGKQSAGGKK